VAYLSVRKGIEIEATGCYFFAIRFSSTGENPFAASSPVREKPSSYRLKMRIWIIFP